jgi:hypothetical protein
MFFDERDLGSQACRHDSRNESRSTGSEHNDIVAIRRLGIHPIRRPDVLQEQPIMLVVREYVPEFLILHRLFLAYLRTIIAYDLAG